MTDVGPDEVRAILDVISRHRTATTPFDFTVAGAWMADPDAARDQTAALADAGTTWAREGWLPWSGFEFDDWRRAVLQGPPR